jgi:FkbM family methyltransferase
MMVPAGDFATVQTLARNFGVRDVTVPGEFGFIQGSIHDTAILSAYACTKTWRPAFAQFFSGLFEDRGGVYIDIGANIGLTTIPVASNPEVVCLSFEPDPENFRYLSNNVEQNCAHRNVELFNLALFDLAGSLDFRLCDHNRGDHRICRSAADGAFGEQPCHTIKVPALPLDDVLAPDMLDGAGPIAVKIVTQGAETHVVAGGRRVLARAAAAIIEIYPYGIESLQGDLAGLLAFCDEQFRWAALNEGEDQSIPGWQPVGDIVGAIGPGYETAKRDSSQYFHLFLKR